MKNIMAITPKMAITNQIFCLRLRFIKNSVKSQDRGIIARMGREVNRQKDYRLLTTDYGQTANLPVAVFSVVYSL